MGSKLSDLIIEAEQEIVSLRERVAALLEANEAQGKTVIAQRDELDDAAAKASAQAARIAELEAALSDHAGTPTPTPTPTLTPDDQKNIDNLDKLLNPPAAAATAADVVVTPPPAAPVGS